MNSNDIYDLVVIGGGSAGLTAAIMAGRLGAKTLLVDRDKLGGDCLHTGCVPSKALIRCAKAAHHARQAKRFGVMTGPVDVDFGAAMDYVRSTIATIAEHDSPAEVGKHGVEVAFGGARFEDPHHLRIGSEPEARLVRAERTILATGSRAAAPPIPGLDQIDYLTNESLFELTERPGRVAVIGGGPIGIEMGQSLSRLGSEVVVLQRGARILPKDDAELSELLQGWLREELRLETDADTIGIESSPSGTKTVKWSRRQSPDEEVHSLECDAVLVAVGRRANTESLNLDAAGVDVAGGHIVVDDALHTTAESIWAAGDCTGSYQFTHFAEAQARIATRNALFWGSKKSGSETVPWATFSDPELAQTGATEEQARLEHGSDVRVYRYPFDHLDRAICDGAARGLAKVITDAKGRILGASILGPNAADSILALTLAMDQGIPLRKLGESIFVYPAMSRIVRRLSDEEFMQQGVSEWTRRLFGRFKGA